ncbi:MAG: ribose 5-phosphate isomerase A [Legionellales bacterium]|nr:ribose 5-phosphate isomerase A [Legionellales bacterium]|tara:strand:+ start:255 stop:926 length:672 start_codon:yes stop_codon:yes gene_type:complete
MDQESQKQLAARSAIELVDWRQPFGVGSGSTVNYFIDALKAYKQDIQGVVPASIMSRDRLIHHGIPVLSANQTGNLDQYFDGADEVDNHFFCIKGRGAAMTQERIVRAQSASFICMIDQTKFVSVLGGQCPIPVEVLTQARSYVSRRLVAMGGAPALRHGVITEQNAEIVDAYHLPLREPVSVESQLDRIAGVIGHGLFASDGPNVVILSGAKGVELLNRGSV